ncbi:MAG: zinc ribbon domain-containing protein [Acholeplasmataceae bacterium]|nr:zinc ribbon domain-containing protein [Acholeplasmataceae bacterium]
MYCKTCGKEMDNQSKFCPSCGEPVEKDEFAEMFQSNENKRSKNYNTELILGILAVVFSVLNYIGIFYVHLIGITLGAITMSLVNRDKKDGFEFSNAGYIMGVLGFVLGLIAVIIGVMYSM